MQNGSAENVLERLLDPISRCLTPESARALLEMRADAGSEARVAELAARCNEGKLSAEEVAEYETYVHVGNIISILQTKARLLLKRRSAA